MWDLSIVNYCNPNCIPLQSITRLPESEAFRVAKDLSGKYSGTAFGRFSDFEHYYPLRIRTEAWLYNCFVTSGGMPATEHPLYFVLQGSDFLNDWFDKGKITRIPLHSIASKHISFTFGDSCAEMDKPDRKDPFGKETLFNLINHYNGDTKEFLKDMEKQYNYIEVQLWDDNYFSK